MIGHSLRQARLLKVILEGEIVKEKGKERPIWSIIFSPDNESYGIHLLESERIGMGYI